MKDKTKTTKLFNAKGIKKEFKIRGFKIGKAAIEEFIKNQSSIIEQEIDNIIRSARISGRKVVRREDIQ